MAVRVPDPIALEVIRKGAERVVEVSDDEIAEAIRNIYTATHNCAEGGVPRRWLPYARSAVGYKGAGLRSS